MVARVMEWRDVRHVPVEDEEGHLVGIVSHRSLLRMLADGTPGGVEELVAVRQIMNPDPVSVAPTTPVSEAVELMRRRRMELAGWELFEVGKGWREADADVAEAIDYLEYYGREMMRLSAPRVTQPLPGESNVYLYEP